MPRRTLLGNRTRPRSFVEYSKELIDRINAWHSRDESRLPVTDFTRTARSLHFYDSVLVVDEGSIERPRSRKTGTPSFDDGHVPM